MPVPQHVDRQTFLKRLRKSGLLTDEQWAELERKLPDTERGRVVARALVMWGWLTKFQAERVLVGRTQGFHLDQYRILDELGRGGMGRVFKAEHRIMRRVVALKVLSPELLQTDKAQELFLREIRAAARLVHPHIVGAFDARQAGGRHYLVMEFVDGPNLDQLVRDNGPLPVGQACAYVKQVASGLQCAHEQGLVHCDIKPANILVQRAADQRSPGVVKVSDFGIAMLRDHGPDGDPAGPRPKGDAGVVGTPDYVAPEQARDMNRADIRSDLYSLGCTFYFLLSGRVPFPGGDSLEKLVRHGTEEPAPVESLRPDVPEGVAALVRRLMAKDPARRFQAPADLEEALAPFAGGSSPWVLPRAGAPDEGWPSSDPDIDADEDDASALVNTLPPDLAPTSSSTLTPDRRRGKRRVLTLPLLIVAAVLAGLLLAAALVLLIGKR